MRDLLEKEENPDAKYYDQISLHIFFAVCMTVTVIMTVPMLMTMTMTMTMIMGMPSTFTQVRYRMEKHITKEATHGEGQQYVSEALSRLLIAHEDDVHREDKKDGHH